MDATITAVKKAKGSKHVVVVTIDGEEVATLGGARAARAEAVIVWRFTEDRPMGVYGVRGNLAAAQTEAVKLVTQTSMRHHGRPIPVVPAFFAVAVPVEVLA